MTLYSALSKYNHLSELGEYLNVSGNVLTPTQRRAAALLNLTNDFWEFTESGLVVPGAGLGAAAAFASQQSREGNILRTRIFIDLAGLDSSTTDLDIIGEGASPAYLGQLTAAAHGAPSVTGRMVCLETPATGADDIDLYSATEATGALSDLVTGLTQTAIVTAGGAWVAGIEKPFIASIAANQYLYLTGGEAGTAGTYSAGKFMIEIEGSIF